MEIPGYGPQAPPEAQMQADGDPGDGQQQQEPGDGAHHHEIHEIPEEEGGGFHSKHTFPDGRVEEGDHDDYEEAKAKQDADFGCAGEDEESGDDFGGEDGMTGDGEDSGMDNMAQSYGDKARK